MSEWNPAPEGMGDRPQVFEAPDVFHDVGLPRRRRRVIDLSTAVTLLLGVPWMVLSLFVVAIVGLIVGEAWVGWIIGGWLLSGVLAFVRFTEDAVARVMLRMRKPTRAESQRLDAAWASVLRSAGVERNRYRLWVEDSNGINASASGGHIVGVTRRAVRSLPPRQLEAVLAHELGHHLGGHSWAALITYWYSIPARVLFAAVRAVVRFLLAVASWVSIVGYLLGLLFLVLLGLAYWNAARNSGSYITQFVMLGPVLAPVVVAYFGRRSEMSADRTAAELGYGDDLLGVLTRWQHEGHDTVARQASAFRRLFATHPLVATRIRALETFMSKAGL